MNRTHALAAAVVFTACIVALPAVAAANTTVSGTVTVENGSADGARVTVAPVDENLRSTGNSVRTTVNGSSFSVDAPDSPAYVVRVVHDGAAHYEVLRNGSTATIDLEAAVSGQVVDEAGEPRPNTTVSLLDEDGFSVDRAQADENGTFAFAPLESNETYRLAVAVDGVQYRETVDTTDGDSQNVTVSTPPPVDDPGVLSVAGGNPVSHVVRVLAPQNRSGLTGIVETITLQNGADRPFAGTVVVGVPADGQPYSAMAAGEETDYRRVDGGVAIDVSVPANGSAQVGVAYDVADRTLEKQLRRDAESLAVSFQGYDIDEVNHSENLRVGDSPVPTLTADGPVNATETISVDVSNARSATAGGNGSAGGAGAAETGSSESNSIPEFPTVPVFGGLAAMVGGGLVAYRVL